MPIGTMTFNPLSWEQASAPLEALQKGQQLAQNNLASMFQGPMAQQELQKQQLANALAQQTLPYAGPQAKAQLGLTGAQTNQAQGNAALSQAQALGANVSTVNNLMTSLRQLYAYKQALGSTADTSSIDASINQIQQILSQAGPRAGFAPGMAQAISSSLSKGSAVPAQNGSSQTENIGSSGLPLTNDQLNHLRALQQNGAYTTSTGITPTLTVGNAGIVPNAPSDSPQVQQQKAIENSRQMGIWASLTGNKDLADFSKDIYNNTFNGNELLKKAAINDAEQMKSYVDQNKASALIQPLLQEYQQKLSQIPKADFLPGVRNIAGIWDPNFRDLQNISSQLTAYSKELTNLPAKAFTNQEIKFLKSGWADPHQPYQSVIDSVQRMMQMTNRIQSNQQAAQDYYNKNKTLNGFKPYAQNSQSQGTQQNKFSVIQGPDGKQYQIPSENLGEALKRGAKQIG